MNRGLIAGCALALSVVAGLGGAIAQNDPIAERQALMKEMAKANRDVAPILKGEKPYDAAAVQTALKAMQAAGAKAPALFPENSKTGGDTEALPKIWETKADFDAKFAKLEKDATAAMPKITDVASLKTVYPEVLKNCGGCHRDYRAKR